MSIRVLHFADLHMGEYPGPTVAGENSRLKDIEKMLYHIANEAQVGMYDLVVFAGDAFKTRRPSYREILTVANGLAHVAPRVPVVAISGNHDTPNDGSEGAWDVIAAMNIPGLTVRTRPAADVIHTKSGPVQVFSLPYFTKSTLLQKEEYRDLTLEQINKLLGEKAMDIVRHFAGQRDPRMPSILMAHLSVTGAELSNGQNIFMGAEPVLSAVELEALGFDYVALGHIHKFQQLSPRVAYSGNPERIDFGEADEDKGYLSVELEPGQVPVLEFHKTPARKFVTVEVGLETPEDLERFYDDLLLPDTTGAMVRVKYRAPDDVAKMVNHQEIIRRLHTAGAHYVAGIQAEVERSNRARDEEVTEAMSVRDALLKYLDKNNIPDDGLSSLAQELLQEVAM
jgi:exonuclease SbcD